MPLVRCRRAWVSFTQRRDPINIKILLFPFKFSSCYYWFEIWCWDLLHTDWTRWPKFPLSYHLTGLLHNVLQLLLINIRRACLSALSEVMSNWKYIKSRTTLRQQNYDWLDQHRCKNPWQRHLGCRNNVALPKTNPRTRPRAALPACRCPVPSWTGSWADRAATSRLVSRTVPEATWTESLRSGISKHFN